MQNGLIMDNNILDLIELLRIELPNATCELNYKTPFELTVAVILSAQCTDKRVNIVTEKLFKVYNTPQDFANLEVDELTPFIKPCGYYTNKAKSIIEASKEIVNRFNGKVPSTVEELMTLRGVGQKTANVVYAVAFGGDAIAVDTHVFRVSNRLGLANATKPKDTENQLKIIIPKELWSEVHHLLLHHGRYVCVARSPKCSVCGINKYCKTYQDNIVKEGKNG